MTKQFRALQEAIHLRPEICLQRARWSLRSDDGVRETKTLDQNLADDFFRKMVLP